MRASEGRSLRFGGAHVWDLRLRTQRSGHRGHDLRRPVQAAPQWQALNRARRGERRLIGCDERHARRKGAVCSGEAAGQRRFVGAAGVEPATSRL